MVLKKFENKALGGNVHSMKLETVNITDQIQRYLPGAKPILVQGYSSRNTDYLIILKQNAQFLLGGEKMISKHTILQMKKK